MSKCKYCDKGHKPDKKGYHLIVTSIVPAKITFAECKNFVSPDERPTP